MTLKEKLETLSKEWTTLAAKIKAKLSEKDNALTQIKENQQDTVRQLETTLKENTENEKVLEQLMTEFQELAKSL